MLAVVLLLILPFLLFLSPPSCSSTLSSLLLPFLLIPQVCLTPPLPSPAFLPSSSLPFHLFLVSPSSSSCFSLGFWKSNEWQIFFKLFWDGKLDESQVCNPFYLYFPVPCPQNTWGLIGLLIIFKTLEWTFGYCCLGNTSSTLYLQGTDLMHFMKEQ